MGVLQISTRGSFKYRGTASFSAQTHGHAHAVALAIQYLSTQVLPAAIEQDHRLQAEGAEPTQGFAAPKGT